MPVIPVWESAAAFTCSSLSTQYERQKISVRQCLISYLTFYNLSGTSLRGIMTQEVFFVSFPFISIFLEVEPFTRKYWLAVVLQSLLFLSCGRIDDSSAWSIPILSNSRRSLFKTTATAGWGLLLPVGLTYVQLGIIMCRTWWQKNCRRVLHVHALLTN